MKHGRYEGTFTYYSIMSFGKYGPAFTLKTKRHIVRDDELYRELIQYFLLRIPGYRCRILYGINCYR
jgi:hypothetical protein